MLQNKIISLLGELSEAFGPSGSEKEVRDLLREHLIGCVDSLSVDKMGNLIATKGKADRILILSHMDEVGFMITGIREDGTLSFLPVGGIDPRYLPSKCVKIGDGRISGIIGATPIHLNRDKTNQVTWDDLYLEIGVDSKPDAEKLVAVGDFAVFDTKFQAFDHNRMFLGKALDNRIGCAILCAMLQENVILDGTFVFTVMEETGLRGATAFLNDHRFSVGIALDTTTANDLPSILPPHQVCRFGKGGVISFADGATVYERDLVRGIINRLTEKNIRCQTKTKRTGGNEASALEKVGYGTKAISLSTPCRYIHGVCGKVLLRDILETQKALSEIVSFLNEVDYDS